MSTPKKTKEPQNDPLEAEKAAEKDMLQDPDLGDTGGKENDLDEGELAELDNTNELP